MRPTRTVVLALAATLAASVGAACSDASGRAPHARSLPDGWRSAHSSRFEAMLDDAMPLGTTTDLSPSELDELRETLGENPGLATRAALLLARSLDPDAYELLLERVEERQAGPAREDDAGDCTAVAALARHPLAKDTVERLLALAVGDDPHPDVEVRAECAIAALANGRTEGAPLLVRIMRIDTPSEAREGPLTDSPNTAWVRGRADEALCRHLGIEPYVDRTDAPFAEREAWADELERRLGASH
ncbi:MAG: hypothetical protein R3F34_00395 [Planctomycetota bacterium]